MRKLLSHVIFFLFAWLALTGLSLLLGMDLFKALDFRGPMAMATLLGLPVVAAAALTALRWRAKPRVVRNTPSRRSDDEGLWKPSAPHFTGLKDFEGNDVYI